MYNHIVKTSYVKNGKTWMYTGKITGKAAKDSLLEDYIQKQLGFSHIKRIATHFKAVIHTTVTVYYDNDVKAIYTNID